MQYPHQLAARLAGGSAGTHPCVPAGGETLTSTAWGPCLAPQPVSDLGHQPPRTGKPHPSQALHQEGWW